jgi:hypothetical protein
LAKLLSIFTYISYISWRHPINYCIYIPDVYGVNAD